MKNPLFSKTLQGIFLLLLPRVLKKCGVEFSDAETQSLAELICDCLGGLLATYGRFAVVEPLKNPLASSKLPGTGLLLFSTLIVQLSTGCASIHQTATSSIAPDGTEERRVDLRVTALGDAKQAIEKLNASSGKTVTAGAKSAEQESTSESLKTLLDLLKLLAPVAKP